MSAIVVDRLTKRFGDFAAVDGVSFEVPEGQLVAVLGPNGAGKTTTLEMLEGFLPPPAAPPGSSGSPRTAVTAGGEPGSAWCSSRPASTPS